MTEKEAPEGKSLDTEAAEEPSLKEDLAATLDKLEAEDEPEVETEEEAGEESPEADGAPGEDAAAEDDEDTAAEDSEDASGEDEASIKIDAHLPEPFKQAVKGFDEDVARVVLDTVKTAESRANTKFEEAAEARKFYDDLNVGQLKPLLNQAGTTPEHYFTEIMRVEQAFRNDPVTTIAAMVQQAGLGADGIARISAKLGFTDESYVDPDIKGLREQVSGLEGQLRQRDILSQQNKLQTASAMIEAFKTETRDGRPAHPHFDRVEAAMGGLMNSGQARDLQEAYDKAVRLDDELFNGILSEKEQSVIKAREAERKKSVQKSKAASRNATGRKPSQSEKSYPDDLRSHLGQVFDELEAG